LDPVSEKIASVESMISATSGSLVFNTKLFAKTAGDSLIRSSNPLTFNPSASW